MLLSIITINYNNKAGLQKTMASVISQSFTSFEWILIDGGSTDGSLDLIKSHLNSMSYWCSEPDSGIYNAMNKGIKKANGKYILFLNSGDYLHDEYVIENVVKELDGTDFIVGNTCLVNLQGEVLEKVISPTSMHGFYLLEMALCHQSTLIKSTLLKERPYSESLDIVADWEQMFFELIINKKGYKHIDIIISDYLMGGVSDLQKQKRQTERKKVIDKYLTQKQQDVFCLEYFSSQNNKTAFKKLFMIAYTAFVNHSYSSKNYEELFSPYQQIIFSQGSLCQRGLVWLSLHGQMKIAHGIYNLLKPHWPKRK